MLLDHAVVYTLDMQSIAHQICSRGSQTADLFHQILAPCTGSASRMGSKPMGIWASLERTLSHHGEWGNRWWAVWQKTPHQELPQGSRWSKASLPFCLLSSISLIQTPFWVFQSSGGQFISQNMNKADRVEQWYSCMLFSPTSFYLCNSNKVKVKGPPA